MTINQYEQYIQEKSWDDRFRYMLLDRMRMDCDYFLGNGQIYGNHLWAGNVTDQIGYMKALWESFPVDGKPEFSLFTPVTFWKCLARRIRGSPVIA